MEKTTLKIKVSPAPGEGQPLFTAEYQDALGDFLKSLRSQGVEVSPRFRTFDAIGAGGGLTGEFAVIATTAAASFMAIRPCLVEWIKGRSGRKARLKVGDIEAEAQTVEEVEKLMKLAEQHQKEFEK